MSERTFVPIPLHGMAPVVARCFALALALTMSFAVIERRWPLTPSLMLLAMVAMGATVSVYLLVLTVAGRDRPVVLSPSTEQLLALEKVFAVRVRGGVGSTQTRSNANNQRDQREG